MNVAASAVHNTAVTIFTQPTAAELSRPDIAGRSLLVNRQGIPVADTKMKGLQSIVV